MFAHKIASAFVLLLALVCPLADAAAFVQKPSLEELAPADRNCVEKMKLALVQYDKTMPGNTANRKMRVVAWNDLMCTDPEWMMNTVVVIDIKSPNGIDYAVYSILHIHFLSDGTFKSASLINDEWKQIHAGDEWEKEWCGFIKTVYPEDYARQCTSP